MSNHASHRDRVEVRDTTGKVVWSFIPSDTSPTPAAGYVVEGKWPTEDELDRIERDGGRTYTPEEVVEHLKSLSK